VVDTAVTLEGTDELGEEPTAEAPNFSVFGGRDSAAPESGAAESTQPGVRQRQPRGTRGATRRAVERALAVNALSAGVRRLLARSLGVESDDVVELAVASLDAGQQAKTVLTTLVEIAEGDAMEAGVVATGLASEKAEFKKVWAALAALDDSLPASAPSTQAKAGLALARAAQGLAREARSSLAKAIDILG